MDDSRFVSPRPMGFWCVLALVLMFGGEELARFLLS